MKRVIFLSLIMLAMLFGLVACKRTVKVGLIDTTGKIVIEPQFKAVRLLRSEDLCCPSKPLVHWDPKPHYFVGFKFDYIFQTEDGSIYVIVDGKCNLVDTLTIPKFDAILRFTDTLACVEINGKYGFIDTTGKIVVEPQFDDIWDIGNGFFVVEVNNKDGVLNKSGQIVIEPQFDNVYDFHEGLACVKVDEKFGFIDTTGKIVIEPQFDSRGEFHEGLARVKVDGKYGFIDTTGKIVIEPQFDDARCFSDGLAIVRTEEGKEMFINKKGEMVFESQYATFSFSDGLAMIYGFVNDDIKTKTGFINTQGEIVIELQYDFAEGFKNGFALVGMDGEIKWYIDKLGNKVNDSTLQSILDKEPLTPVDEKYYSLSTYDYFLNHFGQSRFSQWWEQLYHTPNYGYVDKTGKVVIDFQFEEADDFYDGLARVKVDGKYGFIDKTGKMVIEPQFDHAKSFKNGYALIGMY